MYYQPDLSQYSRAFKAFLLLSIALHAVVLFVKENPNVLKVAAFHSPRQSIQVRLRQEQKLKSQPAPIQKTIPEKKIKTVKKEKTQKPVQKVQEKITENQQVQKKVESSAPKVFDSAIKNYVQPRYPRLALKRGMTGTVLLTLWVKGNGELEEVLISKSSGHQILDNSALSAARKWTFKQLSASLDSSFKLTKKIVYKIN